MTRWIDFLVFCPSLLIILFRVNDRPTIVKEIRDTLQAIEEAVKFDGKESVLLQLDSGRLLLTPTLDPLVAPLHLSLDDGEELKY